MTTYILGAGPAGMAVVDGLVDANAGPFILLEASAAIGGLAQTLSWDDVGFHDLGPHKIFSLNEDLIARVEALLPADAWLTRDKVSAIYMKGYYLPYPPSPFSLAGVFGWFAFIKMVAGYGLAKIKILFNSTNPQTFEEDLEGRVGKPLYNVLFKPIAEKLWGNPKKLDVKLSRGRVQTPSLLEVFSRLLKIKKSSEFEALTFRYPKGGLGNIWQAIKTKSVNHGNICLDHAVQGFKVEGRKVCQIQFKSGGVEGAIDLGPDDQIVSTLPLTTTALLLKGALSEDYENRVAKVIHMNDLLLVFLHVDRPSLLDESWVFIPDPMIVFHRLSEQESFDPAMTPNGSIVCCEIMSSPGRQLAVKSDEELISLVIKDLHSMGYGNFKVLNDRVIRLPKSYPVFYEGFETGLKKLITELDGFDNFRSIGRQGAFNYIGTLDAMDIGYGYVNWLVGGKSKPWRHERERTNHYPVLD